MIKVFVVFIFSIFCACHEEQGPKPISANSHSSLQAIDSPTPKPSSVRLTSSSDLVPYFSEPINIDHWGKFDFPSLNLDVARITRANGSSLSGTTYDMQSGEKKIIWELPDGDPYFFRIYKAPDEEVVVARKNNIATLLDAATGHSFWEKPLHWGKSVFVGRQPSREIVAGWMGENSYQFFNKEGVLVKEMMNSVYLRESPSQIENSLFWYPREKILVTNWEGEKLWTLDDPDNAEVNVLDAGFRKIIFVSTSAHHRDFAILDLKTGQEIVKKPPVTARCLQGSVEFSLTQNRALVGICDKYFYYDLNAKQLLWSAETDDEKGVRSIYNNGTYLLILTQKNLYLLNSEDGSVLASEEVSGARDISFVDLEFEEPNTIFTKQRDLEGVKYLKREILL